MKIHSLLEGIEKDTQRINVIKQIIVHHLQAEMMELKDIRWLDELSFDDDPNILQALKELQNEGLIEYDRDIGCYCFIEP